jgi:hypothetical protein
MITRGRSTPLEVHSLEDHVKQSAPSRGRVLMNDSSAVISTGTEGWSVFGTNDISDVLNLQSRTAT